MNLIDLPLPKVQAHSYTLDSASRKSAKVKQVRGALSYEIAPGTTIKTASGEIIDMSSIGIADLEVPKVLQAKKKFESKMKNR